MAPPGWAPVSPSVPRPTGVGAQRLARGGGHQADAGSGSRQEPHLLLRAPGLRRDSVPRRGGGTPRRHGRSGARAERPRCCRRHLTLGLLEPAGLGGAALDRGSPGELGGAGSPAGPCRGSAAAAISYRRTEDLEGDFLGCGGVLPPSGTGGSKKRGGGRSPHPGFSLSVNSLVFRRGPHRGADLGGPGTPPGSGTLPPPCPCCPPPPQYLIPLFFFLIFFLFSGPVPCLSAGVVARPPHPQWGHPSLAPGALLGGRRFNLINLNAYLSWSLPRGPCATSVGDEGSWVGVQWGGWGCPVSPCPEEGVDRCLLPMALVGGHQWMGMWGLLVAPNKGPGEAGLAGCCWGEWGQPRCPHRCVPVTPMSSCEPMPMLPLPMSLQMALTCCVPDVMPHLAPAVGVAGPPGCPVPQFPSATRHPLSPRWGPLPLTAPTVRPRPPLKLRAGSRLGQSVTRRAGVLAGRPPAQACHEKHLLY